MPRDESVKKVLVLGSGAIKIGEAGEFDYSGSQCLKALAEEGVKSVLINPNIATIQTDTRFADKVYPVPINTQYVEKVIKEEKPDSIMLGFGGQTALNCGVALHEEGLLEKYGLRVLGTQIKGIEITEDRQQFKDAMLKSDVPVLTSYAVNSIPDALKAAKDIGYPVIIRVAYTLGGRGGGVAHNEIELQEIAQRGLNLSMVHQVLIEKYVGHWKQIEYEVMRDYHGNSVIVCNMENVLAMRVHTGDNIVIAPSQTLNNYEYHMLPLGGNPRDQLLRDSWRVQHPVRARPDLRAVHCNRDKREALKVVCSCQQGHRLSAGVHGSKNRPGIFPARAPQQDNQGHHRVFRAVAGLLRSENAEMGLFQVRAGQAQAL